MNKLSPRSRVRLRNVACAYCHKPFDAKTRPEEEHVIGRKFVPRSSLAAQWNLIVNACGACNDEKCALENDISAITMRSDLARGSEPNSLLLREARRKETSKSTRTGKAVHNSAEELKINGQLMPGVTFSAKMVSDAQIDRSRVYRLAFFHVSAFFYFITFDREQRQGRPIPWCFGPITVAPRQDWGNAQMLGFQELIAEWPHRVHAVGANGYFKIVIRRAPEQEPPLWAWAVEWNQNFRVIGLLGDEARAQAAFDRLPVPRKALIEQGIDPEKGPFKTWMREEVSIRPEDDRLFALPAEE